MLSVQEALLSVLDEVQPLPPLRSGLGDALGLVLAEEIVSDIDSPPFDKALMDGFAVRSSDVQEGASSLRVIEQVNAGQVPSKRLAGGEAIQIMTGAPMPQGADAVVPVEATEQDLAEKVVKVTLAHLPSGANVLRRGTSAKIGEKLMSAGRLLRPQELGALAELGRHELSIRPRPKVAVLATGDELVPIDHEPGPGQIRNSNETMLVAQIRRAGAEPVPLGIARDEPAHLRERILAGLRADMLLLSGGVSAGQRDLVPAALESVGVHPLFHMVDVKPGKPIWFGRIDPDLKPAPESGQTPCYVFGLPGNPVSSMVCFELFARTALRRLRGVEPADPQPVQAALAEPHTTRGDRPVYHPARLEGTGSGPVVSLVRWQGSADLQGTVAANSMARFPPGEATFAAGSRVDVFRWDS
jgi:molybdopterin molybdotransferase